MPTAPSEQSLRQLVDAIVANNSKVFSELLAGSPTLATATFANGASRQDSASYFIKEIGHQIYPGDTALHFAAAAYRRTMADALIKSGSGVRAQNRRRAEPLHAAASGSPGSLSWDPPAQVATIICLIENGADPNARNMDGATPLHIAVRARCASAVQTLLNHGANPNIRNKSGSLPRQLALQNTGRSGSGSLEAKAQQQEILQLFAG